MTQVKANSYQFKNLYAKTWKLPTNISIGDANKKLAEVQGEAMDISIEFDPKGKDVELNIRGQKLVYQAGSNKIQFGQKKMANALQNGTVKLRILVDRGSFEVFLNGGITVLTRSVISRPNNKSVSLAGNDAVIKKMTIHQLKSSWTPK